MDAKGILGLPKTQIFPTHERKTRPQKESQRKPDGISREVYALTGGLAPLIPSHDITQLKQRHHSDEKITWQWLPFTNSARIDSLQLFHWVRVVNGVLPTTDYLFAKYNKSVDIVSYTDEDYERFLTDPMWTKEDTDRLFEMCKRFDLRFVIIADRFPSSRSVEELKDRYYSVSRAIRMSRTSNPTNVSSHPVLKDSYNMKKEIERKRTLSKLFSQTRKQESRDASVIAEAKRITEFRKAAKAAEVPDLPVTMNPDPEITDSEMRSLSVDTVSPLNGQFSHAAVSSTTIAVDNSSVLSSLRALPVYLRSYAFEQIIQSACSNVGLRTLKRVEQTLQDLGVNMKPKMPTKAVCAEHLELRKEILTFLNLQKQYKEAENVCIRDGSYSEMPNAPPKRVAQRVGEQDPTFVADVSSFGGQVVGKKDPKRKGVRQDNLSPAQMKRPRKLKISEG